MVGKQSGHPIMTIRLPQEYRDALDKLASKWGATTSELIRSAVEDYLKEHGVNVKKYEDGRRSEF